jgi:hypothetical protein
MRLLGGEVEIGQKLNSRMELRFLTMSFTPLAALGHADQQLAAMPSSAPSVSS